MQAEQNKDPTERQMTKIAREAAKFTVQMMKADGIGTAEFDFIHLVRHNPGMTQADVRAALKIDKGAAARRAASLEAKGYLVRKPNPDDGRSQLLYATPKAEELKNSKAAIETVFYAWLVEELPEAERDAFLQNAGNPVLAQQKPAAGRVPGCDGAGAADEWGRKYRMKNTESAPVRQPDRVLSYFENQRPVLAVVTVSGLIYNLGLVVGPWFEGPAGPMPAGHFERERNLCRHGGAVCGLFDRHCGGAGVAVHQAAVCAQVCQQHQPQHETGAVRQSGAERQG